MQNLDPLNEARTDWLDIINSLGPSDFAPVAQFNELPNSVYFYSLQWSDLIFQEDSSPFREGGMTIHSYHVARPETIDLIQHTYLYKSMKIVVTESVLFTHILWADSTISKRSEAEVLIQAENFSTKILAIFDKPKFEFIEDWKKYRAFSTAPSKTITQMHTWSDRIDGVIYQDGLALLCYKVHKDFQKFIDPSTWFDKEFRGKAMRK